MNYSAWLHEVNELVEAVLIMGIDDLPDAVNLVDMFESGSTPEQAAESYLEEMGDYLEEDLTIF